MEQNGNYVSFSYYKNRANKLYASLEINQLPIPKANIFSSYRMMQFYEMNGIFLDWDCISLKD